MQKPADLLKENRPNGQMLTNIFGALDGRRLPCVNYVVQSSQNVYYEGHATCVRLTNLLVFNFHGKLVHSAVNYPGSWHDSTVA